MNRLILAVAALGLVLGSVSLSQGGPILIGAPFELTGDQAAFGTIELDAVRFANELRPTVLGRSVEIVAVDTASSASESSNVTQRLIDQGVVALVGWCCSRGAIPAAEVAQAAGVVSISVTSTNPQTTLVGEGDPRGSFSFRVDFIDPQQGGAGADFVFNTLGGRRVLVVRQIGDAYSFGLTEFFTNRFIQLGGEVNIQDVNEGQTDFSAQVAALQAFNPDVVYSSAFPPQSGPFIRQARDGGYTGPFAGGDAILSQQTVDLAGADAILTAEGTANVFATSPVGAADVGSPEAQAFLQAWQARFGDNPDPFETLGFDAYNVVIQAIENIGPAFNERSLAEQRVAIRDALLATENFPGASGSITFVDTDGTPRNRVLGVFRMDLDAEGKLVSGGLGTLVATAGG
ncbi:MAG: ABC transporter substrate-binding protein [Deinococcus sp.]|nr:ABC transporter substrate-binding protein [Deinococcus sp.]